jgi:phosphatidylglycerophosphatase A
MQTSPDEMKAQKFTGPSGLTLLFLTWFYSGKAPKAPGTFGSLATLPLIILLSLSGIHLYALVALIVALTVVAVMVTQRVQVKYGIHDPQWIVIDEVIGMLITWSFVQGHEWYKLLLVTIAFRFFDIVKFWPASYFDRDPHGYGTILDDVVSGLYAGIFTYGILTFFNA